MSQRFRCSLGLAVQFLFALGQLCNALAGGLVPFQFFGRLIPPSQQFFHTGTVTLFHAVNLVQPFFDLIQLPRVKIITVQAVGEVGGQLPRTVIQIAQALAERCQALIQASAFGQLIDHTAQQIRCAHHFAGIITGKRLVRRRQTIQNALCVHDDLAALHQTFFLACGQRSGINGINLFRKLCDPALLFFLAGSQRIQRALCRDKSAVQRMVSGILCPILRVLIQQGQMGCRVGQAGAVVLAMDGQQPGGNIPHHAGGSGHTVNTAAAFSVRADLAVQQQVILGTIAAFFHLLPHMGRDRFKRGPNACLGRTAAHQITRGTVAQNGIDGIDHDRFAGAGFARQHIQARGKLYFGFFNHGNIFNFQLRKHGCCSPSGGLSVAYRIALQLAGDLSSVFLGAHQDKKRIITGKCTNNTFPGLSVKNFTGGIRHAGKAFDQYHMPSIVHLEHRLPENGFKPVG